MRYPRIAAYHARIRLPDVRNKIVLADMVDYFLDSEILDKLYVGYGLKKDVPDAGKQLILAIEGNPGKDLSELGVLKVGIQYAQLK